MRSLRVAGLISALMMGGAGVAAADPGDGVAPKIPSYGPSCYGSNYSYHVWNLFAPQEVYGVDSCVVTQLIAQRNAAGNYANYVALVSARVPVLVPASVFVLAWNTSTANLSVCAAPGRGVEFVLDNRTGVVLQCRAQ